MTKIDDAIMNGTQTYNRGDIFSREEREKCYSKEVKKAIAEEIKKRREFLSENMDSAFNRFAIVELNLIEKELCGEGF